MRDASPGTAARSHAAEHAFRENTRRDALRWLASQLRWERTLDQLRCEEREQTAAAA